MNTMTVKTVNAAGMKEIADFLAERHKKGSDFGKSEIEAWAADADFQLAEGNSACIEIRSFDSVSGHTETYEVSAAGVDSQEIEID